MTSTLGRILTTRVPPQAYFVNSAVFHYLGPAFAVLLFARVDVLGVAWLRIAAAAAVFLLWRRPLRVFRESSWPQRRLLLAMGVVLGAMNACFYLAIDRLPLGTVGAIEFLGPILLAALGARTPRNALALLGAIGGVWLLTEVRLEGEPLGYVFAFVNAAGFMLYTVIGHRLAADGGSSGIDRLGAAMVIALIAVSPIGLAEAAATLTQPLLLLAGIAVGICSSVIPYVSDQLAMARMPRATFSLMLALLPATATAIGALVLRQIPSVTELAGVALVITAVAVHRAPEAA
ncbi:MAG: EamA family transporter [Pseudonocardiales bacterium]|nr:EamA family transporter [Pseudonocardiales bacterium]